MGVVSVHSEDICAPTPVPLSTAHSTHSLPPPLPSKEKTSQGQLEDVPISLKRNRGEIKDISKSGNAAKKSHLANAELEPQLFVGYHWRGKRLFRQPFNPDSRACGSSDEKMIHFPHVDQ